MPDFQYTAREASGQQVAGVLTAASKQDALGMLAARSLFPLTVASKESAEARERRASRGVSGRYLATFYSQLADLLKSGVPLLRSLELLERQTRHPRLKLVLQEVREQVAEGTRLAEAMRQHPRVFGDLAVSMVRAGEEGSFLEEVLKRVATFTEHQQEMRSRVVGAMVYPLFLMGMGSLIVVMMLVFFVPKFEPIFSRMREQGSLPWATTTLLAVSAVAQQLWVFGVFIVVGGGAALYWWLQTDKGRRQVDLIRLKAPGIGAVTRSLAVARFCRILGTLLKNGVPLLLSLRIGKDAAGNVILSEAIGTAADNISSGKSLAQPLAASKQFPEEVVEMIAVGEEANNLEQVLVDVAENMERRTHRLLDLTVRMLEPVMLSVMGLIILFVVVALLWPIMQVSNVL